MEVFYDFAPCGLIMLVQVSKEPSAWTSGLLVPEEEGARMLRNIGKSVNDGKA